MKPTLLFATFSMLLSTVGAIAESELESLRNICAEQERQIRMLEDENSKLRLLEKAPLPNQAAVSTAAAPPPVPAPETSATESVPQVAAAAPPAPVATPVSEPVTSTYTVKAGDSLERIARKLRTSPETLGKLNKLKPSSVIRPGQKLNIPGSKIETPGSEPASTEPGPLIENERTHKVQAGETFGIIAKKHQMPVEALLAANPKIRPSALRPGQVIQLEGGQSSLTTMISAPATKTIEGANETTTPTLAETSASRKKVRSITIENEMTFGEFAKQYGTDADRLNSLNGLDLTTATVLAKGSELYVPGQP